MTQRRRQTTNGASPDGDCASPIAQPVGSEAIARHAFDPSERRRDEDGPDWEERCQAETETRAPSQEPID